jgi:hypothetical protein
MSAENVIRLKALLAEKFPGVRMRLEEPRAEHRCLASGLPQIDKPLRGGFPKGALSEIIVSGASCGSATLIRALVEQAARAHEIVTLIDGNDAFNATQPADEALTRLLWIRCRTAADAVKAADLVLRDNNLPLVLLDLKSNPEIQLRKIGAATWYRFQRLVEETGTACLVFTPRRMVAPAQARVCLHQPWTLPSLDHDGAEVLRELTVEAADARQGRELEFTEFQVGPPNRNHSDLTTDEHRSIQN